ncbi:catalytic domain of component of various dehydrogenase complexes [Chthoniobacter flavus Ellin428]|uniref:Dihydrolipoamide acetyltransferase component of pyruvate dehydrogenase complex n=1 Tax=Chthoniobacter flavus Ellin428 TaxID=497964 RepID=B4CZU7_9BACT|nr:2-oxo acid dehydrogenase subunit E2 [Chthoniobacter flavus]EDY20261.1 catalytic domain of component of various dehydrogenase complexes [Chthoniobacter flavus Ellin428]TCO94158.1 2-oxoglutarate dehydrogenase E2 component (dihydrolipoamide succinyltransferase) [Chthoniobacter flavus]
MPSILVPTINSNESAAKLLAWKKAPGESVQCGETIAIFETTKASFDLAAEHAGILHPVAAENTECAFGSVVGYIFADEAERTAFRNNETQKVRSAPETQGGPVITHAARELIAKLGITAEQIQSIGKKVIKAEDVEKLVPAAVAPGGVTLSAQQRAIAGVVKRSHAQIPDSFLVKKIRVDAALTALAEFSRSEKVFANLPDLLVWVLARLPEKFPLFFGALSDDLQFFPSAAGNIGVTFDLGRGLFIPVIKEAGRLSLGEIAKTMMAFRMKAMRASFQASDLSGGDLSLSINMDADTLFVQPVILPPQTAMISIGSVQTEWVRPANGADLMESRYIQLGIAFDHRVINGFGANGLANAIKEQLESGPSLTAATGR